MVCAIVVEALQGMEEDDFDYTTREVFEGVNGQRFFSPAEICMLSHRILYSIKVPLVSLACIQLRLTRSGLGYLSLRSDSESIPTSLVLYGMSKMIT